ncbi:MAG: M43 family zinc metalloprotease [Planctomycetota bacterium]|jgi:hypothetical protein
MKCFLIHKKALVIAILLFMTIGQSALAATAYVPVRISIKFILSSTGSRPATGRLNTDEEINAEFDWGNTILADSRNMSEFRIEKIQFVDLPGVSQYYSSSATSTNRDNLRADAIANPTTYKWRTDAINIYINGGTSSAIGKFPPDNDIILMNQGCTNTPSCILHEIGHNLDLMHTHQSGGADGCSDTIADNSSWTKDQIAQNAFGKTYANCTASEKDQVDLVFNNVMSYHVSEPQLRLSPCQLGRVSTQGDSDRAWLLTRDPVYVRSHGGLFEFGTYAIPYKTIQAAINSGLSNEVLVLQQGSYTEPTSVMDGSSYVVTRSGTSYVGNGCQLYSLPVDLENSKTLQVSNAIKAVQGEDNAARQVIREAKEAAALIAETDEDEQEKSSIMENAELAKKLHENNAIGHLLDAELFAIGKEKVSIQLELAERYKFSGNCTEAIGYFILVADNTTQPHLRTRALFGANNCHEMLDKTWGSLVSEQQDADALDPEDLENANPVIEKSSEADVSEPDQPEEDITPAPPEELSGEEKSEEGKVREKQLGPEDIVPED